MVQEKWWAPQKLVPQVEGTPKHTPQSQLPPTSLLLPLTPPHLLSLSGNLRTSWGLRKPWEPLEAFGSLASSVRYRGLPPPHPLTLSHSPCSSLSPEPPWAPGTFLGPQEALGAFGSLWQSCVFSQTQGPHFICYPSLLTPSHSPLPLSLPGPLGPSWGLKKPWEPSEAFGSLRSSVRLWGLASFAPSHPLASSHSPLPPYLPGPLWAPGTFLGPQEALGAFTSLRQAWVFSHT